MKGASRGWTVASRGWTVTSPGWTVLTTALVAAILFPLYWALVASFTPESRLLAAPSLVPRALVLDHYRALFDERDFWTPIRNSLIVAGLTTGLSITLGAACAYALARLRFPGKAPLLAFILAVSMFPQISIVSPLYLLLRALHLLNTYPGLVLPYLTFAMPLTIWMLVGFFRAPAGASSKKPRSWTAPAGCARCGKSCCRWPRPGWPPPPS